MPRVRLFRRLCRGSGQNARERARARAGEIFSETKLRNDGTYILWHCTPTTLPVAGWGGGGERKRRRRRRRRRRESCACVDAHNLGVCVCVPESLCLCVCVCTHVSGLIKLRTQHCRRMHDVQRWHKFWNVVFVLYKVPLHGKNTRTLTLYIVNLVLKPLTFYIVKTPGHRFPGPDLREFLHRCIFDFRRHARESPVWSVYTLRTWFGMV